MTSPRLKKTAELDDKLAEVAGEIRVLSSLSWPKQAEEEFLSAYRAKQPRLPEVQLKVLDHSREIAVLDEIQARCDRAHPLDNVIYKTARSYEFAARMLQGIGTPDFLKYSGALYGRPNDRYRSQSLTALNAADQLLEKTDDLIGGYVIPETPLDIPAEDFAERLKKKVNRFFDEDQVEVVLDPELSSKAIAGAQRIRLRAGALFSELDLYQLLYHEAHIHSATMLNGRRQKNLKILALGAPRTTRTQEGLAVLAELMTLSLDLHRMRRLALRVRAIFMALEGANFLEVFEFFLNAGQSEPESYQSTVRCFRGGDVRGGVAFTKDTVYLKGMLEVYSFLMCSVHENRPELSTYLFAGRFALSDVLDLAPYFETGFLVPPHYVPHWARDLRTLASAFAFNAIFTRIDFSTIKLDHFQNLEEDLAVDD